MLALVYKTLFSPYNVDVQLFKCINFHADAQIGQKNYLCFYVVLKNWWNLYDLLYICLYRSIYVYIWYEESSRYHEKIRFCPRLNICLKSNLSPNPWLQGCAGWLDIKVVTGDLGMQMVVGCSLKLCLAFSLVICQRNKLFNIALLFLRYCFFMIVIKKLK